MNEKQEIDKQLVQALKSNAPGTRGHEKACSQIFIRHHNALRFYFLKRMGQRRLQEQATEPDDLVTMTITKAIQNVEAYDPNFAFSTWLYKIALHALIDHSRKKEVKVNLLRTSDFHVEQSYGGENKTVELDLLAPDPTPLELMERTERARITRRMVERLKNEQQKKAITLVYFEQLSYEEAREVLGVPMNCFKGLVFKAKANILKKAA